jgi:hypothetical protein
MRNPTTKSLKPGEVWCLNAGTQGQRATRLALFAMMFALSTNGCKSKSDSAGMNLAAQQPELLSEQKRADLVLSTEDWITVGVRRAKLSGFATNTFPIREIQKHFAPGSLAKAKLVVVIVPSTQIVEAGVDSIAQVVVQLDRTLRSAGAKKIVFQTIEWGLWIELTHFP